MDDGPRGTLRSMRHGLDLIAVLATSACMATWLAAAARGQAPMPPAASAIPGASSNAPPTSTAPTTRPSPTAPPSIPSPPSNPPLGPPPSASPGASLAPPATSRAADEEFAFGGPQSAASTTSAIAPYMIGDFAFRGGLIVFVPKGSEGQIVTAPIPTAAGRTSISDDNCVLPVDRVFFLYDHFDNAILFSAPNVHALDVNRYTPGFEKTFLDGNASIELRVPFADTQNADVFLDGSGAEEATEFGNMEILLKGLVYRDAGVAFGGGVGLGLPTAPNSRIFIDGQTQPLVTLDNNAFHVVPFLGLLYTPSDRVFFQTFLEFDIDATGNHVEELGVGRVGTLHDQDLLQTDLQLGYWWYRDPAARYLTGVAPTIEYHYTTTLQNASIVSVSNQSGQFIFGNPANRLDIHNLTLGLELQIGPRALLNIAAILPLNGSNNDNRQFDSELFIQFNRFF